LPSGTRIPPRQPSTRATQAGAAHPRRELRFRQRRSDGSSSDGDCAIDVWVLVAAVLAAVTGMAPAGGDGVVFPFVTGTAWLSAGTVKWTDDRNMPRSANVRWNSAVADAFDDGDVAGALLDGGVWDLAWWSPDARVASYAVLRVRTRYYLISDDAKATFAAVKRSGRKALPSNLEQQRWFDAPLTPGRLLRANDVAPREDTRYGWLIAKATRSAYALSYLTLPDEQKLTLVPGVGITSFTYVHHGTISEANVHLVAYHRGGLR
jgi:hypothetical protein